MAEVVVPDIGDFTGVPIIEILVAVGDEVAVEDPLVVLESEKATLEVPAPQAGKITEILVAVGDEVSEGDPLLRLDPAQDGDGDGEAAETQESAGGDESPPEEPAAEEASVKPPSEEEPAPKEQAPRGSRDAPPPPSSDQSSAGDDGPVHASPVVRRLARERGIDLATVTGTGRKGRILREDVEAAGSGAAAAAPEPRRGAGPKEAEGDERRPLTRIQQIGARNLTGAWQTIPHVTHHEAADVTGLEAFRKELNAEQQDVKITMVSLLLRATAASLREFPRFASQLDGDEIIVKGDLHIGFAVDTPNGLVVPVVRDVDRKGLFEIAGDLTQLSGKAREGKLAPQEMSGAVFTISSLGGIGGTGFTPIVNPPQVCVLGVSRQAMQPVWDGEQFVPRLMLPLSLSYDHRVIDGAAAARFCVHLAGVLRDLRRVLL